MTDSRVHEQWHGPSRARLNAWSPARGAPRRSPTQAAMATKRRTVIRDLLIVAAVLAILTLLAHGQLAATVLIMMPLVFLIFGRRPRT